MDIQNISGADSVPKGFSVKSEIPNESIARDEKQSIDENIKRPPEENKGRNIDVSA
ncbi:MAG: hypothetical protein GY754_15560 [bacterium]|nr:hypothetical protein [bacterium]